MQYISKKQKSHRGTCRETDTKYSTRKTLDTHISGLYYKITARQGYDSILIVYDRITKIVHFVPTTEKTSAEGVAKLFWDNVWKLHGLPESIIMNRKTQFAAEIMKKLNCGDRYEVVNSLSPANR